MTPSARVTIEWTARAREGLKSLPPKVRRGIIAQADALYDPENVTKVGKALTGPLEGYRSIKYSRYRAIYTYDKEELATGDLLIHIRVCFVAVGIRKEGGKRDVYRLAENLIKWGLKEIDQRKPEDEGETGDDSG